MPNDRYHMETWIGTMIIVVAICVAFMAGFNVSRVKAAPVHQNNLPVRALERGTCITLSQQLVLSATIYANGQRVSSWQKRYFQPDTAMRIDHQPQVGQFLLWTKDDWGQDMLVWAKKEDLQDKYVFSAC